MGGCLGKARRDEEEKLDFKGGNVHIITNKEIWDQKIAEANRDGKTVVANFSASWCGPCRVIALSAYQKKDRVRVIKDREQKVKQARKKKPLKSAREENARRGGVIRIFV